MGWYEDHANRKKVSMIYISSYPILLQIVVL